MIKRPLGILCLIIVGIIFLVTEIAGKKEEKELGFSKEELCLVGTICKKEPAKAGEKPVLHIKDVIIEEAFEEALADTPKGASNDSLKEVQADTEKVICYLAIGSKEPRIGSRIRIKGVPVAFVKATNPGQFDMEFYYRILGISFQLNGASVLAESEEHAVFLEKLYQLRCRMAEQLDRCLWQEDAGIMKAMLLGSKGDLEAELKALYQRNGIAHILAISGLHISLLGMGVYKLLRKLGLSIPVGALGAAVFMFCYGIMTGFSVSMLRAVIMFLLHMLAKTIGRTYDMLTAVGVAAVLILLEQPLYLYDSGFVFSFGCVLGIGLLMPVLTKRKNPLPGWGKCMLSACTMAAISYPFHLWFYYQFPPYSVLLNLLVVPLMSFLVAAGVLVLVTDWCCPGLTFLPALLIRGILRVYEGVCTFCDGLPGHVFTLGKPAIWQMMLYLLLMLLLIVAGNIKKEKIPLKIKWTAVFMGMIILSIRPRSGMELTFLDVGQGDCIYIRSRSGNCYLIDGGSTSVSQVGKYRIIPFLQYKRADVLEAVIITHPDMDHISGILELLEEGEKEGIQVKNLVLPQIEQNQKNASYYEVEQAVQSAGIPISYINAGEEIREEGMRLRCVNPKVGTFYEEANEYSVVLELEEGKFRALLTGDAEGMGEKVLLQEYAERTDAQIDVLKVAHHGSRYATSEELLSLLKPDRAIISCGEKNVYGHPHEETLERLEAIGSDVFLTAKAGAVTIHVTENIEITSFADTR